MGRPGYNVSDVGALAEFPLSPRYGSSDVGHDEGDIVHETERGKRWVYKLFSRRKRVLNFRLTTAAELEFFRQLHLEVGGQETPFYFVEDVAASPMNAFLVRKEQHFEPRMLDTGGTPAGQSAVRAIYDYTLALTEDFVDQVISSSPSVFRVEFMSGDADGSNIQFTIPSTPVAGLAGIFQNGAVLMPDIDYVLSGQAVTFTVAPQAGDVLIATYPATGTGATLVSETPAGLVNGSNTSFTVAMAPLAIGTALFQNGVLLRPGTDFSVSGTSVSLAAAPQTGDILVALYAAAGADTIIRGEGPLGVMNGSNTQFMVTLNTPIPSSVAPFHNGVILPPSKYSVSGMTIDLVTPPVEGDSLFILYAALV